MSSLNKPIIQGVEDGRPTPFAVVPLKAWGRDHAAPAPNRPAEIAQVVPRPAASAAGTRLQSVIADAAVRFAVIEPDAIDGAVVDCLRSVLQVLDLDSARLWVVPADRGGDAARFWMVLRDGSERIETSPRPLVAPDLAAGEARCFARLSEMPSGVDPEACERNGLAAAVVVSVATAGPSGSERVQVVFGSSTEREGLCATLEPMRLLAALIGQTLSAKANVAALHRARHECAELRDGLVAHGTSEAPAIRTQAADLSRRDIPRVSHSDSIIGASRSLQRVLDQIQQVSMTDSTVLLLGETGVGKEVLATHLHELSARRNRAMVRVNCAAIPSTLIESELFGREKGAFTGSMARQIGRFELADRSTIFLDEIGDLPADVQVKLLRVLEERQIERLGSPQGIKVDVRIVAATHRKLEERIVDGTFREDLFYRLNVFPIHVPALRDRKEEIPALVWRFVDEFARAFGKDIDLIARDSMEALQRYPWPGNIRELRNVVERAMIITNGPRLTIAVPSRAEGSAPKLECSMKMVDVERAHVRRVLDTTGWRIRGTGGAAEVLGLQPTTLETRMIRLGLSRQMINGAR